MYAAVKRLGWMDEWEKQIDVVRSSSDGSSNFPGAFYEKAFTDILKKKGYDSLIVKDDGYRSEVGGNQILVFDPANVKVTEQKDLYSGSTITSDDVDIALGNARRYHDRNSEFDLGFLADHLFTPDMKESLQSANKKLQDIDNVMKERGVPY